MTTTNVIKKNKNKKINFRKLYIYTRSTLWYTYISYIVCSLSIQSAVVVNKIYIII